jgi:hypothetical protein
MLNYRCLDLMAWTKDLLDNPLAQSQIDAHIYTQMKRDLPPPLLTQLGVTVPMNTNAQAFAARGSNFAIEPGVYAKRFFDSIHGAGYGAIFRGTDCAFEGIYSFEKTTHRNGNRFTFFGDPIIDSFSSTATRNHGYDKQSAAGNLSTNYLTSHQGSNDWTIVSGELRGPAANGWVRTILFDANNLRDVTMVAKVKKVGNQQIIVRATTDSNFPGYGLQMRGSDTLRIERPGLENLGEVTNKTWVNGNWYWLKLQAVGTTIRGKSWADGEAEPGSWDISLTNATYTNGYCGFSGETSNGLFDDMTITPAVDTASFMYRSCNWIRDNIAMFRNGDLVIPFPEASSHQAFTNEGSYNQMFLDLKYCIERIGAENGKALVSKHFSHIWTSAIQQTYNTLFTAFGAATYDHYGTALGLGKRFTSFSHGAVGDSNTYTVPTSITENATNRHDFIPEKVAYNKEIDVYIVAKGTGNWTMTIHDGSNNPTQMCDQHDFSSKTNSYQVTIPNASLTNGAMNTFAIEWDNPAPDVTYHYHLTSTVGDGTVKTTTANDLNTAYTIGYKDNATPKAIEIDIRKTYARTGVPQFLGEWGDYWSTDAGRSDPTRNQAQHEAYLDSMYAVFKRLADDGILIGFQYWRAIGGEEGIIADAGSQNYQLLYEGSRFNTFLQTVTPTVKPDARNFRKLSRIQGARRRGFKH